jgi:hypothetical protein
MQTEVRPVPIGHILADVSRVITEGVSIMAQYDVWVFCNHCGDVHPMGISISLDDGPAERESIGNLYAGKDLPQNVAALTNNHTVCPETKKWFVQKDNNQVFLVPASDDDCA